jgi:hypothetical protein
VEVLTFPQDRGLCKHAAGRHLAARAYLHNGSVPTLRALLFPNERPAEFYRAYDVYDWTNVGFISNGAGAAREGIKFSTAERGNSNAGHLYGTTLDLATKEALLEYLKTK